MIENYQSQGGSNHNFERNQKGENMLLTMELNIKLKRLTIYDELRDKLVTINDIKLDGLKYNLAAHVDSTDDSDESKSIQIIDFKSL